MELERSELEQRRNELTESLAGLGDDRADTYRRNSDALARDRAGVKHEQPEEMLRLGDAEVAADEAIRAAQRELRDIDEKLARLPRRRLGLRVGRALRRSQ